MKFPAVVILAFMAVCVSGGVLNAMSRGRPVELTVFYQLNEKGYEFVTNELYPTYLFVNQYSQPARKRLTVHFKPYSTLKCPSFTRIADTIRSTCSNARLHACAASTTPSAILSTDWHRLNLISCAIAPTYVPSSWQIQLKHNEQCAVDVCVDATALAFCANSVDADDILETNHEEVKVLGLSATDKPILLFSYDGVKLQMSVDEQDKALGNLMAALCAKYPSVFQGCGLKRVQTERQFDFASYMAFPLRRRCDYASYPFSFGN